LNTKYRKIVSLSSKIIIKECRLISEVKKIEKKKEEEERKKENNTKQHA
jgi:hypothetical protein